MLLWDNVPISSFEISLLPDTPTMYCCPDFRQLNKYNQVEMCIYHVSRGGEHGKERMPAIGGISYTTVPIRLQKRVVDVKITSIDSAHGVKDGVVTKDTWHGIDMAMPHRSTGQRPCVLGIHKL